MLEKDISTGIKDYLETLQAMGKLIYLRLNSGMFVMEHDGTKSVIRGCKAGTSDFLVIWQGDCYCSEVVHGDTIPNPIKFYFKSHEVIFLEVKTLKGKQNLAQIEFQKLVESQGHRYIIVRDVEAVVSLLGE